jgi:hypothetical protein
MRDGLYYLKHEELDSALAVVLSRTPIEEFLLQHRRLGHMSMSAVRVLYPTLFNATEKEKLVCDACEFGKHTRSSYIPCGVRSKKLFHTIHSDVLVQPLLCMAIGCLSRLLNALADILGYMSCITKIMCFLASMISIKL